MLSKTNLNPDPRPEQFMSLFLACHGRVYGLIVTLVANQSDAEDLLQETAAAMWRKFDEFEPGTDFAAWAMRFARNMVLKHYEKRRTQKRVAFDDELLCMLCDKVEAAADDIDPRRDALRRCLGRLPEKLRTLIDLRYTGNTPIDDVALRVGQSANAVRKTLGRIRQTLFECINQRLEWEASR